MGKYIMALDQGTTSSRCIIFNNKGEICSLAQKEYTQIYPKAGWVEHDPIEIWSSQLGVAIEALGKIHEDISSIHAIGITNQRETTIVWQCRRTADMIEKLKSVDGMEEHVKKTTGLIPDAYFSASKIAWILDNVQGARKKAKNGELLFGTVDTWLIWNLTNGKVHVTDYTNASRTMLYDIENKKWDEKILEYFNIPSVMLPDVKPSGCEYGKTENSLIGSGIPIAGAVGDQQSALFGQCAFHKGDVKNTYGTGCFLLMNTGKDRVTSANGLLTTLAAGIDDNPDYALEGSVFVAGAAVQWLRDELKIINNAEESMEAAMRAGDTEGVYVVPAFTGLGAPYWNPYARGMIVGLTRGSDKDVIIKSTLDSLAYQSMDVIRAMEKDADITLTNLRVDGGASKNDYLMQFQSDILNAKVIRPKSVETTALGAAFLAGLATGFWSSKEELETLVEDDKTFTASMNVEDRKRKIDGWKAAVECAIFYANKNR